LSYLPDYRHPIIVVVGEDGIAGIYVR